MIQSGASACSYLLLRTASHYNMHKPVQESSLGSFYASDDFLPERNVSYES